MTEITMKIDGMMCGMCEAHVNDAIRKAFPVKKVSASHSKGEAVILAEEELDEAKLREAVEMFGYEVREISRKPYEKKGLFFFRG
ncbi:MAG: cation transporter [Clostridia bacterium]|nr:cation transporter [Clostridia bacterium]